MFALLGALFSDSPNEFSCNSIVRLPLTSDLSSSQLVQRRVALTIDGVSRDEADGSAVYNKAMLAVYDLYVLQFSNTWVWRCPRARLLNHYDANIADSHLDIGPGTGWYLQNVTYPADSPQVTLLDLNTNSLETAAARLSKRGVHPKLQIGSILQPIDPALGRFASIAANFVMHCVPGTWDEKGSAFRYISDALHDDGVFFGSTILAKDVKQNLAAKTLTRLYNNKVKSFHNQQDDLQGLTDALQRAFDDVDVEVVGTVAVFTARRPRRAG